ncbi:hypothetical protein MJO28_009472 [Puccinia striiformis f. sp. tritici]|uniref:Uncharacterized protein n=1 Tax=Puccinia striiformis f. sp. tritici TaxID=168172 RepID=A0ACC0E7C0_9BASI|nr:hypothetical protein MJO28_009472 [Puccinia striiformis f. sp. tritici]
MAWHYSNLNTRIDSIRCAMPCALGNSTKGVLRITKEMFDDNGVSCSNPKELLSLWSTIGLHGISGIQCPQCKANSKKTKLRKAKPIVEDSAVLTPSNNLNKLSIISFLEANTPVHLFFHLELAKLFDKSKKKLYMANMIWPFKLTIFGEVYTLISRGFWADSHYWGKVMCNVNGVLGVWMHDDPQNAGYARLVDTVAGSIGGAHQDTSWVIYSRGWTTEEAAPPKFNINWPPPLAEAPSPLNHLLEEDLLPWDHSTPQSPLADVQRKTVEPLVAKATLGRPKKEKESLSTFQFKPAMDLVDPDAEILQARREASWHVHLPSNLIKLAPKAGSAALTKVPPKFNINWPPPLAEAPSPLNHLLEEDLLPWDHSTPQSPLADVQRKTVEPLVAKATLGRPKKEKESLSTFQFKPAMDLVDPDAEILQARREASWHVHLPSNLIKLAPKAGSAALTKVLGTKEAPAPKKAAATKNVPAPKEVPATKKAPAPKKVPASKKALKISSICLITILSLTFLQRFPKEMGILARPPKFNINSPPPLAEATSPLNHLLEEDLLPLDRNTPQSHLADVQHETVEPLVAKATLGCPKKEKESLTTFEFKPAMDLVDPNAEILQAHREANWHVHLPSNLIELAPKAGSAALTKVLGTKKAPAPKKVPATKNALAPKEVPATKKAPAPKKVPASKKALALKNGPVPKKPPASTSCTPLTSQAAAITPFQPALLTDADWERMAACGDAYWKSHQKEQTAAEIRMSSQDNKPPTPSQLPPTFHPKSCLNNSILNQSQKRKITGCSSIKTPDNKQVACENWIDVNDVNAANDDDQRSSNSK